MGGEGGRGSDGRREGGRSRLCPSGPGLVRVGLTRMPNLAVPQPDRTELAQIRHESAVPPARPVCRSTPAGRLCGTSRTAIPPIQNGTCPRGTAPAFRAANFPRAEPGQSRAGLAWLLRKWDRDRQGMGKRPGSRQFHRCGGSLSARDCGKGGVSSDGQSRRGLARYIRKT
jgi:hypothetical protein